MEQRHTPKVTAAIRQQTPEEERRFAAALDLFLTEWVRQELNRCQEDHEISKTKRKTLHRARPL